MIEIGASVFYKEKCRKVRKVTVMNGQQFVFFEEMERPYEARIEEVRELNDLNEQECCQVIFYDDKCDNDAFSKVCSKFHSLLDEKEERMSK